MAAAELTPVDPQRVPVEELRRRVRAFLDGDLADLLAAPLPAGTTFRCVACLRALASDWSDEEAAEEARERWPGVPLDDTAVVCDDCDQIIRRTM